MLEQPAVAMTAGCLHSVFCRNRTVKFFVLLALLLPMSLAVIRRANVIIRDNAGTLIQLFGKK